MIDLISSYLSASGRLRFCKFEVPKVFKVLLKAFLIASGFSIFNLQFSNSSIVVSTQRVGINT